MTMLKITKKVKQLKREYGKIITNIYPGILNGTDEAILYENEKAIVFIVHEPNRERAFFVGAEEEQLCELLSELPKGVVLENVYRENENPLYELFTKSGLEEYTVYIRSTLSYDSNPYDVPMQGRQRLLYEMYDPECGEYAKETDAEELYTILKEDANPICDEIFTLEKWRDVIKNKECMLYRENGKIICFFVWRLEGKKVYQNLSVNRGTANYLYNIERRIFNEMWEAGIRTYYSWTNMQYKAVQKRGLKGTDNCVKSCNVIYNGIFVKK